ncbi:hypothetical protein CspeluHIS016_0110340 [Cutaneotrichosporon spelunceum]|uniref:NADH:flavin oxidoreductase/NADH oxidase N-terminal domain-containing protein n=1 Tax=Cutaneotrichosporon spelunceum TaxID=1672016 RepID=A0AAD3TP44_9TREE|nr:hypothetical protein CspeluHIS016_0110340 [Cutaneotrichosporon spelunceum]
MATRSMPLRNVRSVGVLSAHTSLPAQPSSDGDTSIDSLDMALPRCLILPVHNQDDRQHSSLQPSQHQPPVRSPDQIGALASVKLFPQNKNVPKLFEPITIRGVSWPNRMWVAPMCMYSSDYGKATDFHFVHHGSMALRGWGNLMFEATAVVPEGRISPEDMGIWSDEHIAPLKRVVDFVHANGAKIGIQLAHAGRKASTLSPWVQRKGQQAGWTGGEVATDEANGWASDVKGASAISFDPATNPHPTEASLEYIEHIKEAYKAATKRAKAAGFDYVEIHGAHGYFLHNFYSPLSNQRTDQYGGSFENRTRLGLEITKIIRDNWDGPLLYRVSASDWLEAVEGPEKDANGEWRWWGLEQTTMYAKLLRDAGVDLLDVSSGGNDPRGQYKVGPGYQIHFAEHLKKNVPGLLIGAVGLITTPQKAEEILDKDQADVVLFGREVLRHIDFPLRAAEHLGVAANPAGQYERAWSRMLSSIP